MKIKQKFILIASGLIFAVGVSWIAFVAFKAFEKSVFKIRYRSDMSALNAGIRESLDRYYDTHNQYPEKLTDLTNDILEHSYISEIPEKPKELEMLDKFVYATDGTYYEIIWEVQQGSKVYIHKEHASKGKITFTEMYINGQLYSGHEFDEGCIYPFSGVIKTYRDGRIFSRTVYKNGEAISEEEY